MDEQTCRPGARPSSTVPTRLAEPSCGVRDALTHRTAWARRAASQTWRSCSLKTFALLAAVLSRGHWQHHLRAVCSEGLITAGSLCLHSFLAPPQSGPSLPVQLCPSADQVTVKLVSGRTTCYHCLLLYIDSQIEVREQQICSSNEQHS